MTAKCAMMALCVALAALVAAACGAASEPRTGTGAASAAPTAIATGAYAIAATSTPPPPTDGATAAATDAGPDATHTCAPPYPSGPPTASTVFCTDPSKMESATVIRIVDGDTIHVLLNGRDETIRFYGIDTTEVGQPCSAEATARTRQLVGSRVRLRPDARERDRYGRLLRYVYTPAGLSVDAEMVDEGLAHAWRADGALRLPMIALENAARSGGVGCLWR